MLTRLLRAIRSVLAPDPLLRSPHPSTARSPRPYDAATWPERMPKYPFAYR
jgi:hypothetical protein